MQAPLSSSVHAFQVPYESTLRSSYTLRDAVAGHVSTPVAVLLPVLCLVPTLASLGINFPDDFLGSTTSTTLI